MSGHQLIYLIKPTFVRHPNLSRLTDNFRYVLGLLYRT